MIKLPDMQQIKIHFILHAKWSACYDETPCGQHRTTVSLVPSYSQVFLQYYWTTCLMKQHIAKNIETKLLNYWLNYQTD